MKSEEFSIDFFLYRVQRFSIIFFNPLLLQPASLFFVWNINRFQTEKDLFLFISSSPEQLDMCAYYSNMKSAEPKKKNESAHFNLESHSHLHQKFIKCTCAKVYHQPSVRDLRSSSIRTGELIKFFTFHCSQHVVCIIYAWIACCLSVGSRSIWDDACPAPLAMWVCLCGNWKTDKTGVATSLESRHKFSQKSHIFST